MIPLGVDENFNQDIVRALVRRNPKLRIIRVQGAGLSGAPDADVLEWAAERGLVLITHDVSTMTRYAYDRVQAGKSMPGIFEVGRTVPLSAAIDDLELIAECSHPGEWEGQVRYLPLR